MASWLLVLRVLPSSEKALRLLAMVMRTGIMSCAQSLSSHVGMGSSSQYITGNYFKNTPISVLVGGSNAVSRHVSDSP